MLRHRIQALLALCPLLLLAGCENDAEGRLTIECLGNPINACVNDARESYCREIDYDESYTWLLEWKSGYKQPGKFLDLQAESLEAPFDSFSTFVILEDGEHYTWTVDTRIGGKGMQNLPEPTNR